MIDVSIVDGAGTEVAGGRGSFADPAHGRPLGHRHRAGRGRAGRWAAGRHAAGAAVAIDDAGVATLSLHDGLRNTAHALVEERHRRRSLDTTAVAAVGARPWPPTWRSTTWVRPGPARSARPALVGRCKPTLVAVTVVDAGADVTASSPKRSSESRPLTPKPVELAATSASPGLRMLPQVRRRWRLGGRRRP